MTSARRRCWTALSGLTVAAVLILSGCGSTGKIQHGTVIDKRSHAASTTPVYEDVYGPKQCRTVTTRPSTRIRTRTSGRGRTRTRSRTQPQTRTVTRRVCSRPYIGRQQTGTRRHSGSWELKLKKGKRTGWKSVNKTTWDKTRIGDRL